MRAAKYQLVLLHPRRELLALEDVAARAGVHPELLRRFIELGLIQPAEAPAAGMMFDLEAVHRTRIIQRLRCDLGINLQGIGVILDLLDRLNAMQRGGERGYQ
jgi:DNA-binding transcriptional MerR regulator